ncbi:MAG TPA: hypothetical protein VIL10_06430 [Marmoricola sp.]|jgi:hypothetical protein
MAVHGDDLDQLSSNELGVLARDAMSILALRGDQASFSELLTMSAHAGQCLGEGARRLASAESWTQVADLSGVSRQAVWSRWRV